MDKVYHFHQNNSGGWFVTIPERGIGENVFIEAPRAAIANARAEEIGLYFNGCHSGEDCSCCGDRWCSVSEHDASDVEDLSEYYQRGAYLHKMDGSFSRL